MIEQRHGNAGWDVVQCDPQLERAVQLILEKLERRPPAPVPSLETVDRSSKKKSP